MDKITEDSPEGVRLRAFLGKRIAEGLNELPVAQQLAVAVSVVFIIAEKLTMPKEFLLKMVSAAYDAYKKEHG